MSSRVVCFVQRLPFFMTSAFPVEMVAAVLHLSCLQFSNVNVYTTWADSRARVGQSMIQHERYNTKSQWGLGSLSVWVRVQSCPTIQLWFTKMWG